MLKYGEVCVLEKFIKLLVQITCFTPIDVFQGKFRLVEYTGCGLVCW